MRVGAVILAAGSGNRFGSAKQFVPLNGTPVVDHAVRAFLGHPDIHQVVLVTPPAYEYPTAAVTVVSGGATRRESAAAGVDALHGCTHVLIHDAARPLVSSEIITRCVGALRTHDACDVTIPSPDTIVELDGPDTVARVLRRECLGLGQTPQGFRVGDLQAAYRAAPPRVFTDDLGLYLSVYPAARVANVLGNERNLKITTQADLLKAERLARTVDALEVPIHGRTLVYGGTGGIGAAVKRRIPAAVAWGSADCPLESDHWVLREQHAWHNVVICTGRLTDVPEDAQEEWEREFALNFLHVRRFLLHLKQWHIMEPGGAVVVVGSSSAYHGRRGYTAYSSAKAALMNYVQGLAESWSGVRLNIVNPGRTATPMRRAMFPEEDPAGLLDPDEVARVIVRVLGSACTGSVFDVRAHGIDL